MIPDNVLKQCCLNRSMPLHLSPSKLLCLCLSKNKTIQYSFSNTHLVSAINLCLHYSSANSMAMLAAHTLYCGVWCIFHCAGVWQNEVGKWGSSFVMVPEDRSLELPKCHEIGGIEWQEGRGNGNETNPMNHQHLVSFSRSEAGSLLLSLMSALYWQGSSHYNIQCCFCFVILTRSTYWI